MISRAEKKKNTFAPEMAVQSFTTTILVKYWKIKRLSPVLELSIYPIKEKNSYQAFTFNILVSNLKRPEDIDPF